MRNVLHILVFVVAIIALSLTSAFAEQSAEEFYKGKTVEYVIPYGVGGGTDQLSRMLIPYLEKRLGCNIVPSNKDGAGGLIGLNYLWESKPNGLVLGTVMYDAAVWATFTGNKAVNFDIDKLTMIGGIEKQALVLVAGPNSSIKTFADLTQAKEPALVGIPGKMSTMHIMMALASDVWEFPVKFVPGYKGAAAFFKAAEGGEVDLAVGSEVSAAPRIKGKTLIPVAYLTLDREPFFPDVPAITETPVVNENALERFKAAVWIYRFARSLGMPPGVPEDRVEFVRKAFMDALKDPMLIAAGEKNGVPFVYTPPSAFVEQKEKLFGPMTDQDREHVKNLLK